MKGVGFYIFIALNFVITLLPLRVLYLFSDFFFIVLYYLPSYRRDIVAANLKNAFPEKEKKELDRISRKYYKHLADLIVETLKVTHMSEREILRRFRFRNMDLIERLYGEGRDTVAVCSHFNNWEWLSSMPLSSHYTGMTVYRPLKNKYFDRFMIMTRSKYGAVLAPMQIILREIIKRRKNGELTITAFIADQTPPPDEHTYWTSFLNQETAFFTGPEKIAVKLDMAVLFIHIIKIRRGYYEVEASVISEHPKEESQYAITERHVRKLEEIISEKPEFWLWSHRRWKHKRVKKDD